MEKELTIDGYLSKLLENPLVAGYIIYNTDGVVMRYDGKGITNKLAIQYTALVSDYWQISRKIFQKQIKDNFLTLSEKNVAMGITSSNSENEIDYIRMKISNQTELIVCNYADFVIICIQRCHLPEKEIVEEEKNDEKNLEVA